MDQTAFDRAMAFLELPEVLSCKPTTIQAIDALFGHTGTWIVRTGKHPEEGWRVYLSRLDMSEAAVVQLVLPNVVCEAITRQRRSLIDRSRRKARRVLNPAERLAARERDLRRELKRVREKRNG